MFSGLARGLNKEDVWKLQETPSAALEGVLTIATQNAVETHEEQTNSRQT
jgi:hypothetical protein